MAIIITRERCPVCQEEDIEIEHGILDECGRQIHAEHCPECGDHYPMVCYDCESCELAQKEDGKKCKIDALSLRDTLEK
jgi:hypothetical protein